MKFNSIDISDAIRQGINAANQLPHPPTDQDREAMISMYMDTLVQLMLFKQKIITMLQIYAHVNDVDELGFEQAITAIERPMREWEDEESNQE
jgi:hypothetical protein